MKVVCVTIDPYYDDVLTWGKVYDAQVEDEEVYSSTGFYYVVTNDLGFKAQYYYGHFVSLEKWRESKIDKIFKK